MPTTVPRVDEAEDPLRRFKAETRLHILDELLRAHRFGWELIAVVEDASDRSEAAAALLAPPFRFDAMAAAHVLDWPLGMRTRRGVEQIEQERDDLLNFLGPT